MLPKKNGNGRITVALIGQDIKYIRGDIKEIKDRLENDYVTKTEFTPVKKIVYGVVSLILLSVAGAALALIVRQ